MSLVEGDQLRLVQSLMGLSSSAVSGVTDLDDGSLTQTLPIIPEIVRRSLAEANLTGWYQGLLRNIHPGAGSINSGIDPYSPGDDAVAPYPASVPSGWDVWLLMVTGVRSSDAGDFSGGVVGVNPIATNQGWGRDNLGALVALSPRFSVARFDAVEAAIPGVSDDPLITEQGNTMVRVGLRLVRNTTIEWHTESVDAGTYDAQFVMGIFPEGLGQDVIV